MKRNMLILASMLCIVFLAGCSKAGTGTVVGSGAGAAVGGIVSAMFPEAGPVVQTGLPLLGAAFGGGIGYYFDSANAEEEQEKAKMIEANKQQQAQAQAYAQTVQQRTRLSAPIVVQLGEQAFRVGNSVDLANLLIRIQPGTQLTVLCKPNNKKTIIEDMKHNGLLQKGAIAKRGDLLQITFEKSNIMAPLSVDEAVKLL